jgi:acyl-CoA hydrolase/GNAT superfamily N-acetyltransferase
MSVKPVTAEKALKKIRSGTRVFIGSGAAEPQHLVEALTARAADLKDVEVLHLLTMGTAPYTEAAKEGRLRHNALFIGPNVREDVGAGFADYTPCRLWDIPNFFRSGRLGLDAALVHVSPPRGGKVSLGVAVDIVKTAIDTAPYVVAQINPNMPWTRGGSTVPVSAFDAFVEHKEDLCELAQSKLSADSLWIGRYVARLVPDGATIQLGIGGIPDAVLAALSKKKDLGVHTEMISDGILPLIEQGVVTGKKKTLLPGKIVTSFCIGTKALYDAVDRNPMFEFRPTEFTNDPEVISKNDNMVSINSALAVDLTGQVAADSLGHRFYSGVGGQVDFVRGALRAKNGRSIIALPSSAKKGQASRIVIALQPGTGVVTPRSDVDFVVTEYGIASLRCKTVRERAIALIQVAHPKFRDDLRKQAEDAGLIDRGHVFPKAIDRYEVDYETKRKFNGVAVALRPLKPTDERKLKELFYSQSPETTLMRFGLPLRSLEEKQFQKLVAIDYENSMAIGAFVKIKGRERLIAVGRYYAEPDEKMVEAAFTVHDDYQGMGIGKFLVEYLAWIAGERGLKGFKAEVLAMNTPMRRVFEGAFKRIDSSGDMAELVYLMKFRDLRKKGNPAKRAEAPAKGRKNRRRPALAAA